METPLTFMKVASLFYIKTRISHNTSDLYTIPIWIRRDHEWGSDETCLIHGRSMQYGATFIDA